MLRRLLGAMACAMMVVGCGPEAVEPSSRVQRAHDALLPPINPCLLNPSLCNTGLSNPGAILGRGWNAVSDQDLPSLLSCLDSFTTASAGLTGPVVTSKVSFISDVSDVKDVLQLDGRVSGGVPGTKVPISGSVFGDMGRTATATTSAVQLLVHTKVEFNPNRITSTPRVSTAALQTFDSTGAATFRTRCGDRYVEQVAMGAEYFAVFKISSTNTSVQSHVKANLAALIGASSTPAQAVEAVTTAAGASPNATVSLNGSLTGSVNNTVVVIELEVLQRGGPVTTNPTSLTEVIARFRDFPTSITSEAQLRPMRVTLKPYSQTGNFGTRQAFSILDPTTSMARVLGPAYAAWMDAYHELSFALSSSGSNMFFAFDANAAAALLDTAAVKLLDIEQAIDACGAGASCTEAQMRSLIGNEWTTLRSQLPVRKQLYRLTGKQFKSVTDAANALSTSAIDGWTSAPAPCHIDIDDASATKRNSVRIWTSSGVAGAGCRYKLFNNGRLVSPWLIQSIDSDLDQSTLVRMSTASNLRLELTQFAWPWSWPISYVDAVTLAGPQGDPAGEPWRTSVALR